MRHLFGNYGICLNLILSVSTMMRIYCRPIKNPRERSACFKIREQIFVAEQKLFSDSDRDEYDDSAIHIAAFDNSHIIGTVRIYEKEKNIWYGGRLAVLKKYRGKAGKLLVKTAVQTVSKFKPVQFKALVQAENIPFFIKLKWKKIGGQIIHHGRPHQLMEIIF